MNKILGTFCQCGVGDIGRYRLVRRITNWGSNQSVIVLGYEIGLK